MPTISMFYGIVEGMMMIPCVKSVVPLSEFRLLLTFDNSERRLFDVRPYLTKGVFSE